MPFLQMGDVEVLSLSGTPEEMGVEHGLLLRDKVRLMVEVYVRRSEEVFGVPCDYFVPNRAAACRLSRKNTLPRWKR